MAQGTGRWFPTADAGFIFQASPFSPGGGGSYSGTDFSQIISF